MPVQAIAAYAYRRAKHERNVAYYIARQRCKSQNEDFDAVKAALDKLFAQDSPAAEDARPTASTAARSAPASNNAPSLSGES